MIPEKTKKLIDWLETTQHGRLFGLDDMKELLSIYIMELADQNYKSFESLPGSVVDAIIEDMKASGEYYELQNRIDAFKTRFK